MRIHIASANTSVLLRHFKGWGACHIAGSHGRGSEPCTWGGWGIGNGEKGKSRRRAYIAKAHRIGAYMQAGNMRKPSKKRTSESVKLDLDQQTLS